MSAKQQGLVWELDIPAHQQQVLLALADHAHHDGSNVRPSVDLLAWKIGRSDRHVRRVLGELREAGLIEVTRHGRGGRNNPTEYQLHLECGPKKAAFKSGANPDKRAGFIKEETLTPATGLDTPETLTWMSGLEAINPDTSGMETLTSVVLNPDIAMSGEPLEPSENPKAASPNGLPPDGDDKNPQWTLFDLCSDLNGGIAAELPDPGKQLAVFSRLLKTYPACDIAGCMSWMASDDFWREKKFDGFDVERRIQKFIMAGRPIPEHNRAQTVEEMYGNLEDNIRKWA